MSTDSGDRPTPDAEWESGLGLETKDAWQDRVRDSAHLSWNPCMSEPWRSTGNPVGYLAWQASRRSGVGSLMSGFFNPWVIGPSLIFPPSGFQTWAKRDIKIPLAPSTLLELEGLKKLSKCLVVFRVIVVHSQLEHAVATGLFGLLGDACVQIVDASEEARVEEARVDALYELAE